MMSVKKMPIDSTIEEFWNVAAIPEPAPLWLGGRLFMIPAWLGEEKSPDARP